MLSHLTRLLCGSVPARSTSNPRSRLLGFELLEAREVPAVVYGLTTNNTLVRFDSAAPGIVQSAVAITGLQANQRVVGIDAQKQRAVAVTTGSTSNSVLTPLLLNPATGLAVPLQGSALAGAADVP